LVLDRSHQIADTGLNTEATMSWAKNWQIASGGTETPFTTRCGRRLLYVWMPATGQHAYLDLDSDLILSDEEAWAVLGK
jgi:hypothetical protein